MTRGYRTVFVALFCVLASLSAWAVEPRTVEMRDVLGYEWRDELVSQTLTFEPGEWTGAATIAVKRDGRTVRSQLSDIVRDPEDGSIRSVTVWFKADVAANGRSTCTITPGATSEGAAAGIGVQRSEEYIELTNGAPRRVGIRVPAGGKTFNWPAEAGEVPAPVQGFVLPSGKVIGPARIKAPFNVKSYEVNVTAEGPLFAEVEVSYRFDTGWWKFRARVTDGVPVVEIQEELNTGGTETPATEFDRFWTLALNDGGFEPTRVFWGAKNSDPAFSGLLSDGIPHPELAKRAGVRANWFASPVQGYELSFEEDRRDYSLTGYPTAQQRVGGLIRYVEPGGDSIGFVGLDTAEWRNPLALRFVSTADGRAVLRVPLQRYSQRWAIDGMEAISPNYTGVVRFVDENTIRRRYGVMLSRAEDETERKLASLFKWARRLSGMSLDEVRKMKLDVPDPRADADWAEEPTDAGTKGLEALRAKVDFKRAYGDLGVYSMGYHYGYAKGLHGRLAKVIDDPGKMTAAQRREMRRLLTYYAYDLHSTDTFPFGTGFHLNNPNMTIMAIEARVKASSLIEEHPKFREWGEWSRELLTNYFERFTKESGAPFENPHYTLGVTMNWAIQANELLMENGLGDGLDSETFRSSMEFILNWLTPPDPRFNDHRVIVPFGNSSYQSVPQDFTQRFVKYYRERDPELAAKLQWFGNQTMPPDKRVDLVESESPELTSGWYEDYGVIFRHGFGTEHETFMHLLAGECFGHYEAETDQMAYTIYAKGRPIHLHFGNGYFPMFIRPWLRNRVSFDMKMEAPERNRIEVESASFSPETEYFRAVREVRQLLPRGSEYPVLDKRNRWTPEERQHWRSAIARWDEPESFVPLTIWNRQMMLVKDEDPAGPNYFVLRDTFGGKPTVPTQLNLWFLADEMTEEGGVFHFDGQVDVDMDVFVNTPQTFEPHTDSYGHQQQPYVRYTGFDPAFHPEGKRWEEQLLLRVEQPPAEDYMVVLYPRLKGEDPPASFTRLGDSAVVVETPLSKDYVFLNSHPVRFENEEVDFAGLAATVRFYKDGRIAVANSEGDVEVTVGGRTVSGSGAFVARIADGKVTTEKFSSDARVNVRGVE